MQRVESTSKLNPIVTSKLLQRRYKSVIYKESHIMVAIFEIAQCRSMQYAECSSTIWNTIKLTESIHFASFSKL